MYDVTIAGAGPVGLALAASLARQGCSVALVERQQAAALAAPAFDGREIALTPASRATLTELGAWHHLPADDIHPLLGARVLNGRGTHAMALDPPAGRATLGHLVPNVRLREALHAVVQASPEIDLIAGEPVLAVHQDHADEVVVELPLGRRLVSRAFIAADARLSALRDLIGIGAEILHLPKTMLVFRVHHARPHHSLATEWFAHGVTIATLPLSAGLSSVVLTIPHDEARRLLALDDGALARHVERLLGGRLGPLGLAGTRHAYPLVTSYADRFARGRMALAGDAAVGMHPVTAHGFNFGLKGQTLLARLLSQALRSPLPCAIEQAFDRYAEQHRRTTRPLYLATNGIVRLFTAETPGARLVRGAVLSAGARLAPARNALVGLLR